MSRSAARLGLALCATLLCAGRAVAQRFWLPDERVLISDFTHIVGIAVDPWRVLAASENGLIAWDPVARRWQAPLTLEDGYPVVERPTALGTTDHGLNVLLGTWAGTLWRVDVEGRRFERLAQAPGSIYEIRGDESGAAWLRTSAGWYRLGPDGFGLEPSPGAPPAAGADDPYLAAMGGQLGLDPALRRWRVTSRVAGRLPGEYYIGTDGGGMARVDTRTMSIEWLPYGMTTRGGGAIARVGDRLWFGGDDTGRRQSSIASASLDLQDWLYPDDRAAPRGTVHAILEHPPGAWIAASDGLFRYDLEGRAWRRFDDADGLPNSTTTALLAGDGKLWVGTSRGLCRIDGDRCGPTLLRGLAVHALARCAEHTWVATRSGLFAIGADGVPEPAALPRRNAPVQGVACVGSRVFAALPDRLLEYRDGAWQEAVVPLPPGTLRTLRGSADGLWIGADEWVGQWPATAGEWSHYIVPTDVPLGPIGDILPLPSTTWLVTPGGILRLELRER